MSVNVIYCNHCGNISNMEVIGSCEDINIERDEMGSSWSSGYYYQLFKCPSCGENTIRRYYWHDMMEDVEDLKVDYEIIYPAVPNTIKGLPPKISKAHGTALRVKAIDANSYAVMLGRVLELVCEDQEAIGYSLFDKISDLSKKRIIPGQLSEIAQSLRKLRNIGAHASLGELTKSEIPVLDNLTRAIIEYIYTAPLLVEEAQKAFELIKNKKK